MDAPVKRRSRHARMKSGKPWKTTDNSRAIAEAIYPYSYLPTSHISALCGLNHKTVQDQLTSMRTETAMESEHYIDGVSLSKETETIYRPAARLATYLMAAVGRLPYRATLLPFNGGRDFDHDLAVCTTTSSIEIGFKATPGYSMVRTEEIMLSPDFPERLKDVKAYFSAPIDTHFDDKGKGVHLQFDMVPDNVFGIEGPNGITFYKLEFEHGNTIEPGVFNAGAHQWKKASVKKKMIGDFSLSGRDRGGSPLYRRLWGFENMMYMYVGPTAAHVESMKKTLLGITGEKGSSQHIFAVSPMLRKHKLDAPKTPKPDPALFTMPWERVGYAPFSLMQ